MGKRNLIKKLKILLLFIKSKEMSKISSDVLKEQIKLMLSERKKRKFAETVELQVGLRDYDPEKDKRFSGTIRLPHMPHPNVKMCVIGNARHCEEAKKLKVPCIDVDGLKKFNKEKKPIKKWAKPYQVLVRSESLMKQIPKLLGNILNKIGKFPSVMPDPELVASKVEE